MKHTKQLLLFLLFIINITAITSSSSSSEELLDFDFETSETSNNFEDYYYNDDIFAAPPNPTSTATFAPLTPPATTTIQYTNAFREKEIKVKSTVLNAWTNRELKRKFSEILPILKVLSSSQKLALAALISAQVSATSGQELNLNQVR